ncbi:MAG: SCO family protein [Gemmatimonadota bacterium]|nr:SCO family protein [Gemmatimonadota bacterium]
MSRAKIWSAGAAICLAVGAWLVARTAVPTLPVLPIGGDFTLTDHHGARFDSRAVRGKVVLVFFGYSMCPDVCPTTLSKLSVVAHRLGDDATKVKTLYITVDPARDTPEVLRADLQSFRLDALGLTGTREETDRVARLFGATYTIVPRPESAARYTVTHTTTLYALDAAGRVRLTFPYEATVDEIVTGVTQLIALGP